jgi:hypothetical protein
MTILNNVSRRIDSVGGLIGSMFAIFVFGIIYEGLKFWREHLMRGNFKRVKAKTYSEQISPLSFR